MKSKDAFCAVKGPQGHLCFLARVHSGLHNNLDIVWAPVLDEERETDNAAIDAELRAAIVAKREGKW